MRKLFILAFITLVGCERTIDSFYINHCISTCESNGGLHHFTLRIDTSSVTSLDECVCNNGMKVGLEFGTRVE